MADRSETLGEVAWDVLQRLVRERMARRPGGHLLESELARLDLQLPLVLRGHGADPETFARTLVEEIDLMLDDAVQHAASFRPGHAWCHRCDRADCEHSRPPGCRHAFVGYGPTGLPLWQDFAQFCLDRRHPDVDRLFERPPVLITWVHDRQELHGGILRVFHRDAYELLGQVTAGFFPVRSRAEEGRGVLALTVQAAASRSHRGDLRIGLNLLGCAPGGEDLSQLWERQDDLPWWRSVRWAQAALRSLNGRQGSGRGPRMGRDELERRVDGILRGLARRLEQDRRSRSRRTRHAERRHLSGERPTRKALEDARRVSRESVRIDERSGTIVILGDRGRTHFFAPNGRLVSSVRYSKDAIARKIKHERWRDATAEEIDSLRERLGQDPEQLIRSGA